MNAEDIKTDCRHFLGEKPCRFGGACLGCTHYDPGRPRILIIKLDALGDVLRTTCVLRGLKREHPRSHITWLVAPAGAALLESNPLIDLVLSYEPPNLMRLSVQRFDLLLSLDKTPRATAVAMRTDAAAKRGFGLNDVGNIYPLNAGAGYAFLLGLDDELKFVKNQRTYQDVIFEACEMTFRGEDYVFQLTPDAQAFRRASAERWNLGDAPVVAVNCGGSAAFAHKMWESKEIVEFIRALQRRAECKILLCGGTLEAEKMAAAIRECGDAVIHTGTENSLQEFAAILSLARVVVTGDSIGMHLALAQGVKVVALFGPTCAQEIEMYGRGEKLRAGLDCSPCYKRSCDRRPTCMEAIRPEVVVEAVLRLLG